MARLLHRYATPAITGLFLVSLVARDAVKPSKRQAQSSIAQRT